MKSESQDQKLSQLFRDLRAADEQQTPSFSRLCSPRVERRKAPSWRLAAAAGCALIAALAGGALFDASAHRTAARSSPAPEDVFQQSGLLLSRWHSPTDFLLTSALAANDPETFGRPTSPAWPDHK